MSMIFPNSWLTANPLSRYSGKHPTMLPSRRSASHSYSLSKNSIEVAEQLTSSKSTPLQSPGDPPIAAQCPRTVTSVCKWASTSAELNMSFRKSLSSNAANFWSNRNVDTRIESNIVHFFSSSQVSLCFNGPKSRSTYWKVNFPSYFAAAPAIAPPPATRPTRARRDAVRPYVDGRSVVEFTTQFQCLSEHKPVVWMTFNA
mmetsp:Transcript_26145/g.68628  ORF Transcript_26145/g.68628 Transcript_26145/m.68628 type:complete len:201 (+) Transcript_26145:592-1194(+)